MRKGRISPDGRYLLFSAGNSDYAHSWRTFPISALSIMEIATKKIIWYELGFFHSWIWGKDSKTSYYVRYGGTIASINIETMKTKEYPEKGIFEGLEISPSGRYLFPLGYTPTLKYGVLRWDLQTDSLISVRELCYALDYMALNDSVVCAIIPENGSLSGEQGIYSFNANAQEIHRVPCPAFDDLFIGSWSSDLSPDGKQILFDPLAHREKNDYYFDMGVWTLNLETLALRQILLHHPHARFDRQLPVWSSNSSFVATWFCAKDSSELLYEYDLNGKPLRQLTWRNTEYWVVK